MDEVKHLCGGQHCHVSVRSHQFRLCVCFAALIHLNEFYRLASSSTNGSTTLIGSNRFLFIHLKFSLGSGGSIVSVNMNVLCSLVLVYCRNVKLPQLEVVQPEGLMCCWTHTSGLSVSSSTNLCNHGAASHQSSTPAVRRRAVIIILLYIIIILKLQLDPQVCTDWPLSGFPLLLGLNTILEMVGRGCPHQSPDK